MFEADFVSKDSDQTETAPRKFELGPLGSLNQVTKGLAKTLRAMADGTLDSQVGARICNGLGIMRACLETQKLEQLEARMDEIADRVARNRTNAARERTKPNSARGKIKAFDYQPAFTGLRTEFRRGLRDSDIAISILPWIERGGDGAPR